MRRTLEKERRERVRRRGIEGEQNVETASFRAKAQEGTRETK